MMIPALVAFVHFFAFFALTAALVLQLGLISESISVETAKRIQRSDRAYGFSAILLLIFGLLRVFNYEKGADYYFSNIFFLLKIGLFIGVGLISLYPTISYMRWNAELKQNIAPDLSAQQLHNLRRIIHTELVGILGILFCASLMARGLGSF
jgi:putative membrane protein